MSIFRQQFSVAESCMRGSLFMQFLSMTISWRHISQGTVATHLRCGGIFNYYFYCKFITEFNSERIYFENRSRFDKVTVQFISNDSHHKVLYTSNWTSPSMTVTCTPYFYCHFQWISLFVACSLQPMSKVAMQSIDKKKLKTFNEGFMNPSA